MNQIGEATAAGFRDRMEQSAAAMASSFSQELGKLAQEWSELAQAVPQNATALIEGVGKEIRQRIEAEMAGVAAEKQKLFEQAISQRLDGALGSLNHALDEAKAELKTGSETIELKFKVSSERHAEDLQKLCGAALEEFRRTADAARESFASEQEGALRQFREEKAPALFRELERDTGNLLESSRRQLQDQANGTLETVRAQFREAVNALEEESKERLAPVVEGVLDSFSEKAGVAVEGYRRQLDNTLRELQQQSDKHASLCRHFLEETEKELSAAAQATVETVSSQAKNAAEGLQRLSQQLTTSASVFLEEIKKRSAAQMESTLATLIREGQATELMAGQVTSKAKSLADDAKEELAAATAASLESLKKEAQAAVEGCRAELPQMILELRDRSARDLETYFQGLLGRQRETWVAQLQKETEHSGERALNEIRNQLAQAAIEASAAVHKQVGQGAIVLKDWADQASARAEAAFQHSLTAFQKQISEASTAALEKHRQESDLLLESAHNLLNEAARSLRLKPDK
jgi:hypothetical protein